MYQPNNLVSIIICVRNSEPWILECLQSIKSQTYNGQLEVSIYNDGSSDRSLDLINQWFHQLQIEQDTRFTLIISSNEDVNEPKGVGFAKNRAVEQSHGEFLCFLDSDDVMTPDRVLKQLKLCQEYSNAIIGSQVCRIPENSTPRYVEWANNLSQKQLSLQIYTCFGPTVLMPTWFCKRQIYDRVGGFNQSSQKGLPEDLIFFYRHLELGGDLRRVDEVLLTYRYHPTATTFSISDETIWSYRLIELERNVLPKWSQITIWNVGKEGRKLFRSLNEVNRNKVIAFCDVDERKISKKWYTFEMDGCSNKTDRLKKGAKPKIPIQHFCDAKPPFIICVKLGLTNGSFEMNLNSMNLKEGIDFVHFG